MEVIKEEEETTTKNTPLKLDWGKIFPEKKENETPMEVMVVPKEDQKDMEYISNLSDYDLQEKIKRIRGTLSISARLPDKGEKFRRNLRLHEEEFKRRSELKLIKVAECEKSKQVQRSCSPGACNGHGSQAASPQNHSQFFKSFSRNLEDKPDMGTRFSVNQHKKALHLGSHNHQSTKSNGELLKRDRHESKSSSRISPARCSKASKPDVHKHRSAVGERKSINASSFYHLKKDDEDEDWCSSPKTKRKKASTIQTTYVTRATKRDRAASAKKQHGTVVLLDEEDSQLTDDESIEWMGGKFYYPSRDDPESVELHHSDMNCLDPEVYLSSPIMNFYIRYLQLPILDSSNSRNDYLIFNTYFYEKIKEAKSCKGVDQDVFFSKFRRWWKGVNIFEKAYILFPIHENFHWSLVIICIPDKEDDTGPLVLHLDSLGYHDSAHIFANVKNFLKKEWKYLKEKEAPPLDLPMADKVWENLPRRIEEKRILVPQQKNDYDCGVFVLFFMERFIKEAPNRLRRKDDDMFGKNWFRAEEASQLRREIRKMLNREFKNALRTEQLQDENKPVSPMSSGKDSGAHSVDVVEDFAECSVDIIEDSNS